MGRASLDVAALVAERDRYKSALELARTWLRYAEKEERDPDYGSVALADTYSDALEEIDAALAGGMKRYIR
jgi:hypothetical protein